MSELEYESPSFYARHGHGIVVTTLVAIILGLLGYFVGLPYYQSSTFRTVSIEICKKTDNKLYTDKGTFQVTDIDTYIVGDTDNPFQPAFVVNHFDAATVYSSVDTGGFYDITSIKRYPWSKTRTITGISDDLIARIFPTTSNCGTHT
jgi:hypothetical protein